MDAQKISVKRVLILAGAFCTMFIGTATASGQECMQFFTNFGMKSFLGIALWFALSLWINPSVMAFGHDATEHPIRGTYQFYLGRTLGTIFDYLIPLFLFFVIITMCSGAGAIFEEHWGWNRFAGVAIIVVLTLVTYLMGTKTLVNILGFIGPFMIIVPLIACLYATYVGPDFAQSDALVAAADGFKAAPHWAISAVLYAAFIPGTMVPFLAQMGKDSGSKKEAALGGIIGVILVAAATLVINFAILSNYSTVGAASVPTLIFAAMMHPVVGTLFATIIFLELYTTVVPMLWMVCDVLPTKKNKKSDRIAATVICVIILIVGQLPFAKLVNILYPFISWFTVLWLIFLFVTQIRLFISRNKKGNAPQ